VSLRAFNTNEPSPDGKHDLKRIASGSEYAADVAALAYCDARSGTHLHWVQNPGREGSTPPHRRS
jgi:hypothetical protein